MTATATFRNTPGTAQIDTYGAGTCLAFRERNGYDDSDFFGLFAIKGEDGTYRFEEHQTGSTAFSGGFIAAPDATPEVLAAYRAYRAELIATFHAEHAEKARQFVEQGSKVTVVNPTTRGKNRCEKGETGTVVRRYVQEGRTYGSGYGAVTIEDVRVQVRLDSGNIIWLDEERVRVTGFEDTDRIPRRDRTAEAMVLYTRPAL